MPFTRDQFLTVFADYNAAVWPAQVLAYLLGLAIVLALRQAPGVRRRVVGPGLAAMWVWTGVVYHGVYFSAINPAAYGFALLFVVQGLLLLHAALLRADLRFTPASGWRAALGWALVAYAALLYPLLGTVTGHRWPALPMFGITPCPVTLFTFGVLLLTRDPVPRRLLVLPFAWALIGGSAAFLLGVPQDWPLLIGGVAAAALLWRQPCPAASP